MMKLNDLVDESNEINWSNVESYIDKHVGERSSESAAQVAKKVCVNGGEVPGPPHVCEHARLIFCVGAVMFGVSVTCIFCLACICIVSRL